MPLLPPDLYCITDVALSPLSLEEQVQQMASAGAPVVQLRAKPYDEGELRVVAENCARICRQAGALFIVNDSPQLAAEVGADGVHIGQGDMEVEQARAIIGEDAIVGISTHNREQFLRALEQPVNYIALGPVFGTTTKKNPDPAVGLEFVREAAEIMKDDLRPLVLIGGITLENLAAVREAAPRALIASIGGVLKAPDVAERVKEWRRRIRGA